MNRSSAQLLRLACLLAELCAVCAVSAQQLAPATSAAIVPSERLSQWLLRNTDTSTDLTSLHWRVPSELGEQEALKRALLQSLEVGGTAQWEGRDGLAERIRELPVTGRLLVSRSDARWLQSAPAQDPVLIAGHSVTLLPRPRSVAVIDAYGNVCLVKHAAGAHAGDYLQACAEFAAQADWAWLVQPDGDVRRIGIAPWNVSQISDTELAPGAWVWAPSRAANVGLAFSDNFSRFLSMQLPAETLLPALPLHALSRPPVQGEAARGTELTASDWGDIGLLQTPSARMQPAGALRATLAGAFPYTRGTVMLQPLDWLEAGFRYSDVANRLYGPEIAGDQSYKDKSIDFKLRIREETAYGPQMALGLRDIGGTGLFSGEYLVANKRWGNWDASLGIGWGYVGGRGTIKAPLALLGQTYNNRAPEGSYSASQANSQGFFHGDAALFGGFQWQTDGGRWVFKAELDGNGYQREPQGNQQVVSSPLNVGVVYRYSPGVDFSAGVERGNTAMFSITLHSAFATMQTPKLLDLPLPKINPSALQSTPPAQWDALARELEQHTGWKVLVLELRDSTLTAVVESDGSIYVQERVDRATAVLHRAAPIGAKRFVLELQQMGLRLARVDVDRDRWVTQRTQPQPPSLLLPVQNISATRAPEFAAAESGDLRRSLDSPLTFSWAPSLDQIIGGPDNFWLYEAGVRASGEYRLSPGTWVNAELKLRLMDNYESFKYDGPSNLPRVRTDQRQYVTTSALTMPLLQVSHVAEVGLNQYASLYAGMLEPMFGGVGGEWMYRPWRSPVAFGVDLNRVRQRGFSQDFAFRDYAVNTGHATFYWDTGWNGVQANLMVGQYLAGDRGATLNVKRIFPNGVAMGAWATKTNLSAEQFGEGTFNKGIFLSVPFDLMLPKSSPDVANLVWDPLTRDGGARLSRRVTLFDLTNLRDARPWRWSSSPPRQGQDRLNTAEGRAYVLSDSNDRFFGDVADTAGSVGAQLGQMPSGAWWAGGALVLAAGLLDRPTDQWAQSHQGEQWNRISSVTNAVPAIFALGTTVLWAGIAGDEASATAKTALTATALTLGTNALTKYAVGRARPLDEKGAAQFGGLQSAAAQSSFTSNHVAAAFALATPWAQAYEQPWIYGLAASSALGRLQSREHWLSDTVAGGLMGYAIANFAYFHQQGKGPLPRLSLSDRAVSAHWVF